MVEIRCFRTDEWQRYRDIRLASLQDTPDAFGATYEESRTYPDEMWQARLQDIDASVSFPVAAFEHDMPVALAWGRLDPGDASTAILNQMWTAPEYRGRGLARTLVESVINWARQTGAGELQLAVTVGNPAAKKLYLSMGFELTGETEPLRQGSEKTAEAMRLMLVPSETS